MKLVSIDGTTLSAIGVAAGIPDQFPGFDVQTQALNRAGAPPSQGTPVFGLRPIPIQFGILPGFNIEATAAVLLNLLNPLDGRAKRVVAARNDGTQVETYATVGSWRHGARNVIETTLSAADPVWRALAPVAAAQTFAGGAPTSMAVPVQGQATAYPTLRVQPTVQRGAGTATVGARWRRRLTVTNNGRGTLSRYPLLVDTGLTSSVVSGGNALASGNDLRVWWQGKEVARTLLNWNQATTAKVWILVESLPVGASTVFDFVWGNPNAGTPPVLAYPDLPAFDPATSTNAVWKYLIDTVGKGLWYVDGLVPPRVVDVEVPGAWRPSLTLPDPDNDDDFAQFAWTTAGSGGSRATFDAIRTRTDTRAFRDERLADGVVLAHPLGIASLRAGFLYENDQYGANGTAPVGKLVILTRNQGAEGWNVFFQRIQTNNSEVTVPAVTYTFPEPASEIGVAVWPYDEVGVTQLAKGGRIAAAKFNATCEVGIDSSGLDLDWQGSAEAVYELALDLRLGGGATPTPPYTRLRVGGDAERRLAVRLGEHLVVDAARRTVEVWNASLTAKVEDAPAATVVGEDVVAGPGVAVTYPARAWLPLRPGAQTLYVGEPAMGTLDVDVLHTPGWL